MFDLLQSKLNYNRIIICGGNGAGKSTLGKYLAEQLGCKFMDIEDYYFPRSNPEFYYPYACARTRKEAINALHCDMDQHENFVLAATKADYGKTIERRLTCAIFLDVPLAIRLRRVRERSFATYGNRILVDGDLYEREENSFIW